METRVLPGSADATIVQNMGDLVCTGACIDKAGTGNWGSVPIADTTVYNYNATTGVMSIKSKAGSTLASVVGAGQKPTANYLQTEPFIALSDKTNLNLAKCYGDTAYCGWQIKESPRNGTFTYYSYSVSPVTRWGDTEFLTDSSGGGVVFDEPLSLVYSVTQSKSPANGKTLNLQYQGNAQLNMPGHCIVRSTGVTVDCNTGSWNDKFYVNDFSVPPWKGTLNDFQAAGTLDQTKTNQATLVNLANSNKSYLAKWMSKGVMFSTVAGGINNNAQCGDLTVPTQDALVLPGLPDWTNPADPSRSNYIGSWQEPSGTPIIIDGVFVTQ